SRLGARIIFLQGGEAVTRRLQNLADEIFGQIEIVASNREQRSDVGRPDRFEQGQERAILEEFGGKARIRPEQERVFAAYDPRVEVGNRQRGRTDGRLAIDLGVMALVDVGVVAAQPNAADGKSAVALALRDSGLLQEQQRAAAGSEIDELRRGRARL